MKTKISFLFILSFFSFHQLVFGQTLNMGTVANFVIFTSNGAEANTGTSNFTGDIGTNLGAVDLAGATVVGNVNTADAVTAQAKADLQSTYIQLLSIPVTSTLHAPAFGGGETVTTSVYSISGAGSLGGSLILDGQGNPDAVFIFKFGGAFSTGATSSVTLENGTRSCNVFWIAQGAVSLAASTIMKGTIIANNGAITMASGCNLEGRLLSTAGAISFGPANATRPACITSVPLSAYNPCYNIILGSVGGFVQFTSTGAVGNTGISNLIGDIGSDAGAISGFGTSSVTGSSYNADSVTAQAKIDLQTAYLQLSSIPVTDASHAPAFGGGEVLTTGVYLISGAGSLAGNLTLDAEGDPDAVFIFRFGGALTTGAASEIILANEASSCNIFWVAEGAISMAAATIMKGTLIANNAANSMAAGGELEGRMLSTTGAIAIDQINASKVVSCHCPPPVPLPIVLLSFTGTCEENKISLEWVTASENNNDYFSIEKSIDGINWENIVKWMHLVIHLQRYITVTST